MESEREEVYERIPWETLEEKKPDRQWLAFGVAGAVVLGALAYSFMSTRPGPMAFPATTVTAAGTIPPGTVPAPPQAVAAPPPTTTPPTTTAMVAAEADLYAVHPERSIDRAAAHAEWFTSEYLTVDGSEQSQATLTALMPAGLPLPAAAEGSRVFVEWVRAADVEEVSPLVYRVSVLARSLAAQGDSPYQRQGPLVVTVDVSLASGQPQVLMAPQVQPAAPGPASGPALVPVPEEIASVAREQTGGSEVLGGVQTPDGGWQVVVMAPAPDGVTRPVSLILPPP